MLFSTIWMEFLYNMIIMVLEKGKDEDVINE